MKRSKLERVPEELLTEVGEVKKMFGLTVNTEAYRKICWLSKIGRQEMNKKKSFDKQWGW